MKNKVLHTAALAALATVAGAGAAAAQSAPAPTHSTSWTGTVGEDRFGEARFKMRGRFQYDVYSSDADPFVDAGGALSDEDSTRSYVRRAFIGVQGRFSERWRYKVDFVLAPGAASQSSGGNEDEVAVDDAFLEYVHDNWSIVIGEHNVTSPLEDRISSLDIPFNERSSAINTFGYGRAAGIAFLTGGANWSASAAVQGDSLNNADTFTTDEPLTLSGRFTFAPIFEASPEGTTLVHLGASVRTRTVDGAAFDLRNRWLNGRGNRPLEVRGAGDAPDEDLTYGAELAAQFGPFGAQAEYYLLDGSNSANEDFEFSGYYVDLYWSLTGESRSYRGNQGSFGAIAPRNPVTNEGGWGHWMLSARYDFLDLSDTAIGLATDVQGEQAGHAVGLDWIPLDHVRFKLNWAHSEVSYLNPADGDDVEADIISLRTQFDF